MSRIDEDESVAVVDFSFPFRGREGVMYPLMYGRVEEVDLEFVMDVDERELVIAPDLTMLSGAKGVALSMIVLIMMIDAMFLCFTLNSPGVQRDYLIDGVSLGFVLLSIPFCIWVFRCVRYKSRVETVVFNRVDKTVSHYGADRVVTLEWSRLKPFIRIVRAVGVVGGTQTQLLILAETDKASRKTGREVIVGRGDVISAGALRYGFFETYMSGSLEDLPGFRLASFRLDWMQRIARSLWMVPVLGIRWLGEKPWSVWIELGSIINTVIMLPLLAAEFVATKVSLGPRGEAALGPWHKRFYALPTASKLRSLARHHGGVVAPARRSLYVALVIGSVFWLSIGMVWVIIVGSSAS